MNTPPLIAVRANDICFLGILRSCGIAGIPVVPVVYDWPGAGPWLSEASKYFVNPVRMPNPATDEQGAVDALVDLGRRLTTRYGRRLMIVPSSDTNLMLLQNNFDALVPYYLYMGSADFSASRMDVIRKDSFAAMLEAAGAAIPRTLPCLSEEDIERVVAEIPYPCVYKPTHKDYIQSFQNRRQGRKAVECADAEELQVGLAEALGQGYELIVQEKLEITQPEDEIFYYVYADSEYRIRMACCARKEGEFPPRYGTGTLVRLTWIEELLDVARLIVETLRWRGIMEIEFIRHRKDSQWKVIEVNLRPWLSHHQTSIFGFNYTEELYRDAYGQLPPYTEPQIPSPQILALQPLYVNLAWVLEQAGQHTGGAQAMITRLSERLATLSGAVTFSYLDNDDPQPGLREIEHLTSTTAACTPTGTPHRPQPLDSLASYRYAAGSREAQHA